MKETLDLFLKTEIIKKLILIVVIFFYNLHFCNILSIVETFFIFLIFVTP